jgi:ABC-type transport system involved in cytochrome bd biosynthesis fused ATPase/permease subunit
VRDRLRDRQELGLARALWRADRPLATAWWTGVVLRGLLPAALAVAIGAVVGAADRGDSLTGPLVAVGVTFVLLQVLNPLHLAVSWNLGDRTAASLFDALTDACVDQPGLGHLEDPDRATDLAVAREFDSGMTGPPLSISMDFIAGGLVEMVAGLAAASLLFGFTWWAPLLLGGAWLATHWLLRESGIWRDRNTDEVRSAQRDADYAYRLAVDPPSAKEVRLFGLADWVLDRFVDRRRTLHRLQYEATRLRERSLLLSLLLVVAANVVVFVAVADAALDGRLGLDEVVVFAQAGIGASMIAFGGLNWALDGAAAPVAAVGRLGPAMARSGALQSTGTAPADGMPAAELRFRDVDFAYPAAPDVAVLSGLDLTVPAGSSLAIVGQNGAGKTTLAKLLCRLYDPTSGAIEVDGTDLRGLDVEAWRRRVTAVFQDFVRFELSLRENVAPAGAPDEAVLAALDAAGAAGLASLDTPLAKGYADGTDLSGGQWQRVALARALCAVSQGAGLVLLDEPTAQLDVRGEAEIFDRILAATRHCTTILVSHRFSTVRHADRICVLEGGRVVELGTHDELMAAGGRYRTMFDLQAERFAAGQAVDDDEEGAVFDVL